MLFWQYFNLNEKSCNPFNYDPFKMLQYKFRLFSGITNIKSIKVFFRWNRFAFQVHVIEWKWMRIEVLARHVYHALHSSAKGCSKVFFILFIFCLWPRAWKDVERNQNCQFRSFPPAMVRLKGQVIHLEQHLQAINVQTPKIIDISSLFVSVELVTLAQTTSSVEMDYVWKRNRLWSDIWQNISQAQASDLA